MSGFHAPIFMHISYSVSRLTGEALYTPIPKPQRFVGKLLRHRRRRESEILSAVAEGAATIPEIVTLRYRGLDPCLRPAAAPHRARPPDQSGRERARHLPRQAGRGGALPGDLSERAVRPPAHQLLEWTFRVPTTDWVAQYRVSAVLCSTAAERINQVDPGSVLLGAPTLEIQDTRPCASRESSALPS